MTVGIDRSRHDDLTGGIDSFRAGRDGVVPARPTATILEPSITNTPDGFTEPAMGMIQRELLTYRTQVPR